MRNDGTYKMKIADNEYLKDNVPRSYYKGRLGIIFTPMNYAIWVLEAVIIIYHLY